MGLQWRPIRQRRRRSKGERGRWWADLVVLTAGVAGVDGKVKVDLTEDLTDGLRWKGAQAWWGTRVGPNSHIQGQVTCREAAGWPGQTGRQDWVGHPRGSGVLVWACWCAPDGSMC